MAFWSKWFESKDKASGPVIKLGRYSDAYKQVYQYRHWDQAMTAFNEGQFELMQKELLHYLEDPSQSNLNIISRSPLCFELRQGSRVISVENKSGRMKAVADIARFESMDVIWMRQLLERNYDLQYSRYAIKEDNTIQLIFDSSWQDLTPYKFYYGLKELAINADKEDDLILDSFETLSPSTNGINSNQVSVGWQREKYKFLSEKIRNLLESVDTDDKEHELIHNGLSYQILDLVYTLDFCLLPQGVVMDKLEEIHNIFFTSEFSSAERKNLASLRILREIKSWTHEKVEKEMYRVSHTFGVLKPVHHETICQLIEGEKNNIIWYRKNGRDDIVEAICRYIIGFSVFTYAPPEPVRMLLELYYDITEQNLINAIGGDYHFWISSEKMNATAIKQTLGLVETRYNPSFPNLDIDADGISFENKAKFSLSYLDLIKNLDLTEVPL